MDKLEIYNVEYLDYKLKDGIFEYNNKGVVESKKVFPIYGDKLFKPLSRTKPFTTPLFAFSEVFWSYYINKYFEPNAPRYSLAICNNIEKYIEKYYSIGTLVPIITKENQRLVSLLEYYKEYPDSNVNIDKYVNYCNVLYSYQNILKSKIFNERKDLRHKLENQILLSILKQDDNFHYENLSFIVEDNEIIDLCPTLDSEFSVMFLFPDDRKRNEQRKDCHLDDFHLPYTLSKEDIVINFLMKDINSSHNINLDNVLYIIQNDIEVIDNFIINLDKFISDIESKDILLYNNNFLKKLNSDSWKIGHSKYKENNLEKYKVLKEQIVLETINIEEFNINLKNDCLESAKTLKFKLLALKLLNEHNRLDNICVKECLDILSINITEEEYNRLSCNDKLDIFNKNKSKIKKY